MLFVIDLDLLQVISAATDKRAVVMVEGKRGDDSPFEVVFVRSGVAEELAGSSVLTFGAKQSGKYDSSAVVLDSSFTLSGSGTTAKYTASPSFNTDELNALFLINDDDSDDPAYVDLMAEFSWQVGSGPPSSTKTFAFRVHNDVVRDSELSPTAVPTPIGDTAPVNADLGETQQDTATVIAAAGCTSNGTCNVVVTGSYLTGSPLTIPVSLTTATHTTAALIASAIRVAVNANSVIAANYTTGGTGANIELTDLTSRANDATLNIAIPSGLGITAAPTSTNTTAGVAFVLATATPPYIRVAGGFLYIQEAGTWKKTALSTL